MRSYQAKLIKPTPLTKFLNDLNKVALLFNSSSQERLTKKQKEISKNS